MTYQNLKKVLYCCLLLAIGSASVVAGIGVNQTYREKAEALRISNREANKTTEEKAREAKAVDDRLKEMKAEEEKQKKAETDLDKLFKKSGVPRNRY